MLGRADRRASSVRVTPTPRTVTVHVPVSTRSPPRPVEVDTRSYPRGPEIVGASNSGYPERWATADRAGEEDDGAAALPRRTRRHQQLPGRDGELGRDRKSTRL